MSNKRFKMDILDFYYILAIIFWFVGGLFSGIYPSTTLLLYSIALIFCYCADKKIRLL